MLRITEEVRRIVSKPIGLLFRGDCADTIIKAVRDARFFACVGDIVSYYALELDLKPDIIVFDGRTLRKSTDLNILRIIDLKTEGYKSLEAVNPAGCITEDLIEKLHEAVRLILDGFRVKLFVKGEEDLSVLPLVVLLPKDSIVLYGQPNEGIVRVDVNDEKKGYIFELLERMEKIGNTIEKLRRWCNGFNR